ANALVPAFLGAEEADERSPLYQTVQTMAEHLPTEEALRHVAPWVPKRGRGPNPKQGSPAPSPEGLVQPSKRGPLLVKALAERLPPETFLAALDSPLSPVETRTHLRAVLQRRAEAMSGETADRFFGKILALRLAAENPPYLQQRISPEDVRGTLRVLAARV